jgi:hypothetical protein
VRAKNGKNSAVRRQPRGRLAAGICLLASSGLLAGAVSLGTQPAAAAVGQMSAAPLVISPAVQQHLLRLFAAYRHLRLTTIAPAASGRVLGAQLTAGGMDWAMVHWQPSAGAGRETSVQFQDGAGTGIFTRRPGGVWTVAGLGGQPTGCAAGLPLAVRQLWDLPGCPTLAGQPGPRVRGPAAGGTARGLVTIALAQVGVADNPPVTSFNGLDCNPYTTLVGNPLGASSKGCKTSSNTPYFQNVQDVSEFWCADFTKWVWQQAGVTSELGTLTPAAASFYTWGADHGEHIPFGGKPKTGDAVILYPPDTKTPNGSYADHVGIVTAVHSNGTVNLVNGDFLGATNISVQYNTNVHLSTWASIVEGNKGEKWAFVSPRL